MTINLPPIAAAEPPAAPTPATGGNGSSFGQFLDNAGSHGAGAATSAPAGQPTAAASSTTSQAPATVHAPAADGGKGGADG